MADEFANDFYNLPEYFITDVRIETCDATDFTRVFYFARRGGLLCPISSHVFTPSNLMAIGERFREHGMHVRKLEIAASARN